MSWKHGAVFAISLVTLALSQMGAKTFTVTSTGDESDPKPSDDVCGILLDDRGGDSFGPCTLRAAIQTANANSTTDTIQFNLPAGSVINLTQALPQLTTNISITGPGADKLTVRRDTGGSYRVFTVFATGTVTLSGMTISNGSHIGNGGGISNASGTLNLVNCTIAANHAQGASDGRGGGISNASTGTINLSNSVISGNSGSNFGGGLYNDSGIVTITNSTFSDNAAGMSGGAILHSSGTVNISSSTFTLNRAQLGGGITSGGTLTVTGSTFSANAAIGDDFGFNNEGVSGQGGAIYNASGGTLNLTNSTLSGNEAAGGMGLSAAGGAGRGGAVFHDGAAASSISNCTITGNFLVGGSGSATGGEFGGGVNASTPLKIKSSIIALNRGKNHPDVSGSFNSFGFNLIGQRDGSTGFTAATDQTGTIAAPLDPQLDPNGLQDNGGPTKTIVPLCTSPAIDRGTSASLTGNLTTDQRGPGFARTFDDSFFTNAPGGDGTDIGAFERQETCITPATLANISTRLRVETGDNVLIGGIIITGSVPKKIILRALGPSLPLADKLANPFLELHDSSGLLETNDNWVDSANKQAIIDSTVPPGNSLESAILRSVAPGSYTAIVRGLNGGTGIGLIEVYDLDTAANSKLANISTRGFIAAGDNVLIAGTIIVGQTMQKVIVRAIGPSLPFPGKLENPTLELRDGNGGLLEANDDWVNSPNKQAIIDSTIPPTNDAESAIVQTLPANGAQYTAIVRGVGDTTGIAVVEVYALQ